MSKPYHPRSTNPPGHKDETPKQTPKATPKATPKQTPSPKATPRPKTQEPTCHMCGKPKSKHKDGKVCPGKCKVCGKTRAEHFDKKFCTPPAADNVNAVGDKPKKPKKTVEFLDELIAKIDKPMKKSKIIALAEEDGHSTKYIAQRDWPVIVKKLFKNADKTFQNYNPNDLPA